jgi:hypothetical protein
MLALRVRSPARSRKAASAPRNRRISESVRTGMDHPACPGRSAMAARHLFQLAARGGLSNP